MRSITPKELQALLASPGSKPLLLDVREPWEYETCHIEGSRLVPMSQVAEASEEFDPEQEIVVICHHGTRSEEIALFLEQIGFGKVANLEGGVDAWAQEVDPNMATY